SSNRVRVSCWMPPPRVVSSSLVKKVSSPSAISSTGSAGVAFGGSGGFGASFGFSAGFSKRGGVVCEVRDLAGSVGPTGVPASARIVSWYGLGGSGGFGSGFGKKVLSTYHVPATSTAASTRKTATFGRY